MKRVLLALVFLAAACGGPAEAANPAGSAEKATFQAEGGSSTCMAHQKVKPTKTFEAAGDSGSKLQMLHYYTVNGTLPYCDGKAANAADKAWADMYVLLGADPAKVAAIRGK
jgi:hypothetical protein